MRTMWLALVLITLAGVARAGEEPAPKPPPPAPAAPVAPAPAASPPATPLTPEQAADRVLEAVKGKKPEVLKEIAALTDPDPWVVADELCARQEHDAAQAFARAANSRDTEALPAYLTQQKKAPTSAELRTAWRQVAVDGKEKRHEEVVRRVDALDLGHSDVSVLRLRVERVRALRSLSRFPEARQTLVDAKPLADGLAWHAMTRKLEVERGWLDMLEGAARMKRGEYDIGISLARRGAEVVQANGSRTNQIGAGILLGTNLIDAGFLEEAIKQLEGAVGSPKAGIEQTRLALLGRAYQHSGRLADALQVYEQYLARTALDSVDSGPVLNGSASILTTMGEFTKAAERQRLAIHHFRTKGEREPEADGLLALAKIIQAMRASESLDPILERLHALATETTPRERAWILGQTAILERMVGRREAMLDTLRRAVAAARESGNENTLSLALLDLAGECDWSGDKAEAKRLLDEALPLVRRLGNAIALARTLVDLGGWWADRREPEPAKKILDEAIEVARGSGNLHIESRALGMRGAVAGMERDWLKALECAREGESLLQRESAGLAGEAGARVRSRDIWVYTLGRTSALYLYSTPDILHFAEAARAGSLLESLGGRGAVDQASLPPELANAERDLAASEAEAARLVREATDAGDPIAIQARTRILKQIRGEILSIASRLDRERKRAGRVVAPILSSGDEIGRCLAEDQALVLFESLPLGYYAVVVESTGARDVDLGKGMDIPALIQAAAVDRSTPVDAAAIATLREFLVTRLQLPARVKRLIICPLDPLTFIPFTLLAPEMEISYAPSGTTFAWLAKERSLRGQGVLALGDPRYGGTAQLEAAETRGGASRLSPLPATRAEVESVGTVVLLSDQATEKSLRTALARAPRWRAVHLAGHGLVDYQEPSLSSIAVTPTGDDDGFLTLREVLSMKIPADLVVLSACETARGKEYQGEGVFGLTAAFMVAGAPRVLSSLWKVDDAATKALMVKFYELWNPKGGKPGLPTATALKQAQEFVASHEKWKHPYFWAAWVLWGEPS